MSPASAGPGDHRRVAVRIDAFEEHFARAQASKVVELSWGYALLQRDFPESHNHNRVVVTSLVSATEVVATTDEILGGAGLTHRYLSVVDDALGGRLAPDFVAAGFEHESIVTMIYEGPAAEPPAYEVHAVSLAVLRPALIRDWKVELPDVSAAVLDQLADRASLYPRGADVARLAVFEGDDIAARGDVFVAREGSIGQFESLVTHPDFRGRGYSRSLIREAIRRGQEAKCEVFFLTADLNDWPYHWYQRLGFVDVARTHHFTKIQPVQLPVRRDAR